MLQEGGMPAMHVVRFDEAAFHQRVKGRFDRSEDILVGPQHGESCVAATVRMRRGFRTESHCHDEQEQLFIVLRGRGRVTIGDETQEVRGGAVVLIPRRAPHAVVATGRELVYIYVSVWPDRKPAGLQAKVQRDGSILNVTYEKA
jgi:quercetin dioxygenase-like cupin family protein